MTALAVVDDLQYIVCNHTTAFLFIFDDDVCKDSLYVCMYVHTYVCMHVGMEMLGNCSFIEATEYVQVNRIVEVSVSVYTFWHATHSSPSVPS